MEAAGPEVPGGLAALGLEVMEWHRQALGGRRATPWPPEGPFGTVVLRLPRSREALAMALHAGGAALEEGGILLVYGAKDEGIGSAVGPMEELFDPVATVGVGGRCRVLQGRKRDGDVAFRAALEAWREVWKPNLPGLPELWTSYPGVFAHGALDAGTRCLLEALPPLPEGARVLDYGCGSGVVAGVARSRNPTLDLHLLDVDAVALESARENVPGAASILADGLSGLDPGSYDAILSNPPFHRGKEEDVGMLEAFVREAGRILRPMGTLTLVTQRRILLGEDLQASFSRVSLLHEAGIFAVWHAEGPRFIQTEFRGTP